MTHHPRPVTGLTATGALMTVHLAWEPRAHGPLVDHYRVHAVPAGRAERGLRHLGDDTLLARTVYPRWEHGGRSPEGEEWVYVVVTVDAAGRWSRPSRPERAHSLPSVTTGCPVAQVGDFDRRSLELRHAPAGYKAIATEHPDGLITVGPDDGPAQWPYLLPGPGDTWAGSRAYTLRWTVRADRPVSRPAVALWGIDTTRLGGRLEVALGTWQQATDLPRGATKGSREGDATLPGTPLRPVSLEWELPSPLPAGEHLLTATLAEGGWLAWDAAGLFDLA